LVSGDSRKVPTAWMMNMHSECAWKCRQEESVGSFAFFEAQRCLQETLLCTWEMVIA